MSADGKIALPSRKQTRISNDEDMARVHRLRNECDAVLVGVGTILSDDPKLIVKSEYVKNPRNPLRVVLDSRGRTPPDAHVLKHESPTMIVTNESCKVVLEHAEMVRCGQERVDLEGLLTTLSRRGVRKLVVEGGESVIWSFLRERLADELKVFVGSIVIGGKRSPTMAGGDGATTLQDVIHLTLKQATRLGDGILLEYEVCR